MASQDRHIENKDHEKQNTNQILESNWPHPIVSVNHMKNSFSRDLWNCWLEFVNLTENSVRKLSTVISEHVCGNFLMESC